MRIGLCEPKGVALVVEDYKNIRRRLLMSSDLDVTNRVLNLGIT